MDKIKQVIAEILSVKFEEWKPYLTETEQAVFGLKWFKGKKIYQIAMEVNYSERQIKRILKSAEKKISKVLP